MPAAYLHETIANSVRNTFNPGFADKYLPVYQTGAQGPDILFFYRQLSLLNGSVLNNLGELIHSKKCIEFLVYLIQKSKDINAAMAYCFGFLTHYSADSVIHPYVIAMTQEQDKDSKVHIAHMQLEAEFDTWIYRQQENRGIPRQAEALKKLGRDKMILLSHTLANVVRKTFPEQDIAEKEFNKCFDHMNNTVGLLYSPYGIKYSITSFIEKLIACPGYLTCHMVPRKLPDYDFLNLNKACWEHPFIKGITLNTSLPELLDIAVEKSVLLIKHAKSYFDGAESIDSFINAAGNLDYSGLPLQTEILNQSSAV